MNSTLSPSQCSRKRTRERDRSPDMFAVYEDEDSSVDPSNNHSDHINQLTDTLIENLIETPIKQQLIKNSSVKRTLSSLSTPPSSFEHSPLGKILSSSSSCNGNKSPALQLSDSKPSPGCSISSLRSTIHPDHFGFNRRMKEGLKSDSHYQYSSNSSATGKTPAIYTLNNSTVPTQAPAYSGPNYGLSDGVWQVIQNTKGIKNVYQWQDVCLNMAIKSNQNLIYSLPTSGGKTLVAEILMIRELLCNQKHCLFVLPYVSIVQEKMRTLSSLAVSLNFAVEEYAGNRGTFPPRKRKSKRVIYIATMEKAHGIINSLLEIGRISEIGNVFSRILRIDAQN